MILGVFRYFCFMRYLLFITFLCFTFQSALSQNPSNGRAVYKKNIQFKESKQNDPLVRSIYSSLERMQYILEFNAEKSKFYLEPTMDSDITKLHRRAKGSNGDYYVDLSKMECLEENEIMGEKFLVQRPKREFQLTIETKKIAGYTCYKAFSEEVVSFSKLGVGMQDKTKTITAWYAPEIPLPFGPMDIYGLPGLVLELQSGQTVYTITELELNTNVKEIKFPRKQKPITAQEYENILLEQFQKIRKQ